MMKKGKMIGLVLGVLLLASPALATNGDNMIAIGPVSRAMGGVGIANPLDAISAVFANPAAMCFGEYCPASELNFSGTLFMPKTETKITNLAGTFQADAESNVYAIPAIGVSVPIGEGGSNWRFGLAAYGVTGLGVDYRGTAVDNSSVYDFGPGGQFPMITGEYTSLQIMKFAPAVAFQPTTNLSLGAALHIDYGILDLRNGNSSGYSFGIQPGLIYHFADNWSLGLTYISPQSIDHENVADFDQDGTLDTLELEAPQQFGMGLSYHFVNWRARVEADVKWINWSDADGYEDFDWEDQWVFSVGAEFQPVEKLFLRLGYNYGKSPVKEHNGFSGLRTVQGKTMPAYYYETFRLVGFPAIVEHHLTAGLGYKFSEAFSIHLGVMHAFENTVTETGSDFIGMPVTLESSLSETSIDFGLTWRF